MSVTEQDLSCLDAHAHLGALEFESRPDKALCHYEVGLRIGELSLAEDFNGLLPWSWTKNRPYLRCLHGYGLSLWRLEKQEEAGRIFERLLWLNPNDNQGVRFLLQDIRKRRRWEERASAGTRLVKPVHAKSQRRRGAIGTAFESKPIGRSASLAEELRLADDLDRKWEVEDLLEALQPLQATRNALARYWEWEKVTAVSLRSSMRSD